MIKTRFLSTAIASALFLGCATARAQDPAPTERIARLEARLATLEERLRVADQKAQAAVDRGAVENVFSNYMYLHNAFHDEEIKKLWAKRGTPDMSAQYSNLGVYTNYDSIMAYHSGRPDPVGKLIFHYVTTPSIQIAGDGKTAKGLWIVAGVESGLMTQQQAAHAPSYLFEQNETGGTEVHGKRVWAHWLQIKYGVDFIRQDGEWKIWHFRCFEISRARFDRNWISLAAEIQDDAANNKFNADLMYLGEDGKPVYMPPVDGPPKSLAYPYRPDGRIELQPALPTPYDTFSHTTPY